MEGMEVWSTAFCCVSAATFAGALLASASGTGGGALYMPGFTIATSDTHFAVPLAKVTILGVAIGSMVMLIVRQNFCMSTLDFSWRRIKKKKTTKKNGQTGAENVGVDSVDISGCDSDVEENGVINTYHTSKPNSDETAMRPSIAYELSTVLEPCTLMGAVIGVFLNILMTDLQIIICLVVVLSFTAYKTFAKAISHRKKETEQLNFEQEILNGKDDDESSDMRAEDQNDSTDRTDRDARYSDDRNSESCDDNVPLSDTARKNLTDSHDNECVKIDQDEEISFPQSVGGDRGRGNPKSPIKIDGDDRIESDSRIRDDGEPSLRTFSSTICPSMPPPERLPTWKAVPCELGVGEDGYSIDGSKVTAPSAFGTNSSTLSSSLPPYSHFLVEDDQIHSEDQERVVQCSAIRRTLGESNQETERSGYIRLDSYQFFDSKCEGELNFLDCNLNFDGASDLGEALTPPCDSFLLPASSSTKTPHLSLSLLSSRSTSELLTSGELKSPLLALPDESESVSSVSVSTTPSVPSVALVDDLSSSFPIASRNIPRKKWKKRKPNSDRHKDFSTVDIGDGDGGNTSEDTDVALVDNNFEVYASSSHSSLISFHSASSLSCLSSIAPCENDDLMIENTREAAIGGIDCGKSDCSIHERKTTDDSSSGDSDCLAEKFESDNEHTPSFQTHQNTFFDSDSPSRVFTSYPLSPSRSLSSSFHPQLFPAKKIEKDRCILSSSSSSTPFRFLPQAQHCAERGCKIIERGQPNRLGDGHCESYSVVRQATDSAGSDVCEELHWKSFARHRQYQQEAIHSRRPQVEDPGSAGITDRSNTALISVFCLILIFGVNTAVLTVVGGPAALACGPLWKTLCVASLLVFDFLSSILFGFYLLKKKASTIKEKEIEYGTESMSLLAYQNEVHAKKSSSSVAKIDKSVIGHEFDASLSTEKGDENVESSTGKRNSDDDTHGGVMDDTRDNSTADFAGVEYNSAVKDWEIIGHCGGHHTIIPAVGHKNGRDLFWVSKRGLFLYPSLSALAGICAGCLGIGGGLIKGPLMLEIGLSPLDAVASANYMILFTASANTLQFALLGRLSLAHSFWFASIGFIAAILGNLIITELVIRKRRQSVATFLLAYTIVLSMLSMVGCSAYRSYLINTGQLAIKPLTLADTCVLMHSKQAENSAPSDIPSSDADILIPLPGSSPSSSPQSPASLPTSSFISVSPYALLPSSYHPFIHHHDYD